MKNKRIGLLISLVVIFLVLAGCSSDNTNPVDNIKYSVSGEILNNDGNGIKGVTLQFSGGFGTATTDSEGRWQKTGLSGTVTISPVKDGYTFDPSSIEVSKNKEDITIIGFKVITEELEQQFNETSNEITTCIEDNYNPDNVSESINTIAEEVSNVDTVTDVIKTSNSITVKHKDGGLETWLLNSPGALSQPDWITDFEQINQESSTQFLSVNSNGVTETSNSSAILPGNKEALVINTLTYDTNYSKYSNIVFNLCVNLAESGYDVKKELGKDADLNLFRNLDDYGVVYIQTHGGIVFPSDNNDAVAAKLNLMTGEKFASWKADAMNIQKQKLVKVNVPNQDKPFWSSEPEMHSFFGVTDLFFEDEFNSINNTFVITCACNSFGKYNSYLDPTHTYDPETILAESFVNNEASAFIGWQGTNNTGAWSSYKLLQSMREGQSLQEAFNNLPEEAKKENDEDSAEMRIYSADDTGNIYIVDPDPGENNPPKLEPIGDKTINEGEELTFTINASDPDGDQLSYGVNGDLTSHFNRETHTFSWTPIDGQDGTYNIGFAVTDGNAEGDSEFIKIIVQDTLNTIPPKIDLNKSIYKNEVNLSGKVTDSNGTVQQVKIDWGDGSSQSFQSNFGTIDISHIYSETGSYTIVIQAKDNESFINNEELTISITPNNPPTIEMWNTKDILTVHLFGNINDDYNLSSVIIDWGDGFTQKLTSGLNDIDEYHTYGKEGSFNIFVKAIDDDNAETIEEIPIRVKLVINPDMINIEAGITANDNGTVPIAYDFEIGKYEVTTGEFIKFLNRKGRLKYHSFNNEVSLNEKTILDLDDAPIAFENGNYYFKKIHNNPYVDGPISGVTGYGAIIYCNWLSNQENLNLAYDDQWNLKDILSDIEGYRLPTQQEWEYAARGGKKGESTIYAGSNNIDEVGWYGTYFARSVGKLESNELGIYDMSGNIREMTNNNNYRLGGGFLGSSSSCEVGLKSKGSKPGILYTRGLSDGFRIVRTKFPGNIENLRPLIENININLIRLEASLDFSVRDTDGTINDVIISWGDEEKDSIESGFEAINQSHSYSNSGSYTITITATDNNNKEYKEEINISVNTDNELPIIDLQSKVDNQKVNLDGSVYDNDGTINNLIIDWGDGESNTIESGFDNIIESHSYSSNGNYTITMTATDNDGESKSQDINVDVAANQPPEINISKNVNKFTVTLTGDIVDNDGNINGYTIYWGDNNSQNYTSGFENINLSHTYASKGSYTIDIYAEDNDWKTTHKELNVTVQLNQSPSIELNKSINNLAVKLTGSINDNDGEVESVTIDWGNGYSETIHSSFSDINISHSYSNGGTYTITVTAEDNDGITNSETIDVGLSNDNIITFEDPNLEQVVRDKINKPEGNIYESDVNTIDRLEAGNSNISSITGIQYFANLTELYIEGNNISDISPLSNLTNLTSLDLGKNKINNISSLSNLINLTWLFIQNNQLSDISPLSSLTKLY